MGRSRRTTIDRASDTETIGSGGATPQGRTVVASSLTSIEIVTTQPIRLVRHNISDEQLEMLAATNRDGLSEAMWAMIGAAIALLPAAGEALWNGYVATPHTPLAILQLLEIIGLVGTGVTAITIWAVSSSRGKRARAIVGEIRTQRET
jgi:hypothetical protein